MGAVAADLVYCGAANHVEADTGTQGGAIDKNTRIVFSGLEMSITDQVKTYSDIAITGVWRVYGRDGAGSSVYEDFTYAAESGEKVGTQAFGRITKVVLQSGGLAAGATLQVKEDTAGTTKCYLYGSGVDILGVEVNEVRRFFLNATRAASGDKNLYEKFFVWNSAASDVSSAEVRITADPSSLFTFGVEAALDGTATVANRVTAPAAVTFNDTDKDVPNSGNLTNGTAIGVWIRMTLADDTAAGVTSFNMQLKGEGF